MSHAVNRKHDKAPYHINNSHMSRYKAAYVPDTSAYTLQSSRYEYITIHHHL